MMKARVSNMCYSWLTFLLTFLAGRLTFLLMFSSYICSFCLLSAAAAAAAPFVACLLASTDFLQGFQYSFLICWSCCWPQPAVEAVFCLRSPYVLLTFFLR